MYTVTVEGGFSAVHRVRLPDGTVEPPHSHDWVVRAHFGRPELDAAEMVIDFHEAQARLQAVLTHLHHTDLTSHAALAGSNPTAEVVARHVFERIREAGLPAIHRVEVTEAPGCVASFEPTPA